MCISYMYSLTGPRGPPMGAGRGRCKNQRGRAVNPVNAGSRIPTMLAPRAIRSPACESNFLFFFLSFSSCFPFLLLSKAIVVCVCRKVLDRDTYFKRKERGSFSPRASRLAPFFVKHAEARGDPHARTHARTHAHTHTHTHTNT